MPSQTATSPAELDDDRPPSRLMRVPLETYEAIQKSAKNDRRHMNQQLAVLVQEALAARAREARKAKSA